MFRPWKGLDVFLLLWYLCFLGDALPLLGCLLEHCRAVTSLLGMEYKHTLPRPFS